MNQLDKSIMSQDHINFISTFLDNLGDPWHDYNFVKCLRYCNNYFEYFIYAFMNGYNTSTILINYAAYSGKLELFQYLHENGNPCDEIATHSMVIHGHLNCLRYWHENAGFPWTIEIIYDAIRFGHLECLKYAHENGCPWNDLACEIGMIPNTLHKEYARQTECIIYALDNGCPHDKDRLFKYAIAYNNLEVISYLNKSYIESGRNGTFNNHELAQQILQTR